jgi:hypothetical protein
MHRVRCEPDRGNADALLTCLASRIAGSAVRCPSPRKAGRKWREAPDEGPFTAYGSQRPLRLIFVESGAGIKLSAATPIA